MNTAPAPTKTKIGIKSILIDQQEGLTSALVKVQVSTWAAANALLARICAAAPKDGTYHKVSFKISWQDLETYDGRFDASQPGSSGHEVPDLSAHIRHLQEYCAGYACPKDMDQSMYEHRLAEKEKRNPGVGDAARKFLKTYSLADDPNHKPATVQVNDRPKVLPVPQSAAPAPPSITASRLTATHDMLVVILADLDKEILILAKSTAPTMAEAVAKYTKAKMQALEVRKALAAIIKARQ